MWSLFTVLVICLPFPHYLHRLEVVMAIVLSYLRKEVLNGFLWSHQGL